MRSTVRRMLAVVGAATLVASLGGAPATAGPVATDIADPNHPIWDSSQMHTVDVTLSQEDFTRMVNEFQQNDEKIWVETDVTIDGQFLPNSGIKLKGNSSLFDVTPNTPMNEVSFLIRTNKFVDGQEVGEYKRFSVRTNETESSLNEAISLRLLQEAGIPTHEDFPAAFTVNGGPAKLRLVVEDPVKQFDEAHFGEDGGTLYKKKWEGDFSYLGDNPEDYEDYYWDTKGGDEDQWQPLFDFLDWMNNSSDAEFAAELDSRVEVELFARYLAVQDIIRNWDDFDGPGQNGYLRFTPSTGKMTIVPWDHNLSLGAFAFPPPACGWGGGFPPGGFDSTLESQAFALPGLRTAADGGAQVLADPPPQRTTWCFPLSVRAREIPQFWDLYAGELERLNQELVESGFAAQELDALAAPLAESGLVDPATVEQEKQQILNVLSQPVQPRSERPAGGTEPTPDPTDTPTDGPTDVPTDGPTTPAPDDGCSATLTVTNEWGDGYQAEVQVTAGNAAISTWTTSLDLGAGTFTQGWNADFASSGSLLTASDVGWNGALGAGASTEYGFIGTGTPPSSVPISCTTG